MGNFAKRTFFGAIFIVVLIAGIIVHPIAFFIVFLTITLLGNYEFYKLTEKNNGSPQITTGLISSGLLFSACFANAYFNNFSIFSVFVVSIVVIPIVELYRKKENPFINLAYTLTGLLYVALPFSLLSYLAFPFGDNIYRSDILLGTFVMIWTNDTAAYLVGVNFGRNRLFERISPKKSWEGSIGGMLATLLIAWGCSLLFSNLGTIEWFVIGIIVIVFGTLGDLVESLLKRSISIKDSGSILPGHGGMLDRFDAFLLVSPMVFVFLRIINEFFN